MASAKRAASGTVVKYHQPCKGGRVFFRRSFIFWHPRTEPLIRPRGYAPAILLTGTVLILGLAPNLLIKAGNVAARGLLEPAHYIAAVGLAP